MKTFLTLLILLHIQPITAQPSYKKYHTILNNENIDNEYAKQTALQWKEKAAENENWEELAAAFKELVHRVPSDLKLRYSDSCLIAAKRTANNSIIGAAYMTKGALYYQIKQHEEAFNNYIEAQKFFVQANDPYLSHKATFAMGQIKYFLNYNDEAIAMFQKCADYYHKEDDYAYLMSMHALGLCYNKVGNYILASAINKEGRELAEEIDEKSLIAQFQHSEGISAFGQKKYSKAIALLDQSLGEIKRRGDFANESVAYYYQGEAHRILGQTPIALNLFVKMDSICVAHNYTRADIRQSYRFLIDHYTKRNDTKNVIKYTNRLNETAELLLGKSTYIAARIAKEYDNSAIREEKSRAVEWSDLQQKIFLGIMAIVAVIISYLIWKQRKKQIEYDENIARLLSKSKSNPPLTIQTKIVTEDTDQQMVDEIVMFLEKFENNYEFLTPGINAQRLAESIGVSEKLFKTVVLMIKHEKFSEYLNTLKINYIVALISERGPQLNYSIEGLALEAGFNNRQHFTREFTRRIKISPKEFLAGTNLNQI